MNKDKMSVKDFKKILLKSDPQTFNTMIAKSDTKSFIGLIEKFVIVEKKEIIEDKQLADRFFTFLSTLLLVNSLNNQSEVDSVTSPKPLLSSDLFDKINYFTQHYARSAQLY